VLLSRRDVALADDQAERFVISLWKREVLFHSRKIRISPSLPLGSQGPDHPFARRSDGYETGHGHHHGKNTTASRSLILCTHESCLVTFPTRSLFREALGTGFGPY
jgi:hypothetical protein